MKRMTIHDLMQDKFLHGAPFINVPVGLDFLQEYIEKYLQFDIGIDYKYGKFEIYDSENFDDLTSDEIYNYIDRIIYSIILRNEYKLRTLWNSTKQEYDPISNYDRNENWKEVRTPNLTTETSDKAFMGQRDVVSNLGASEDVTEGTTSVYSFNNNAPERAPRQGDDVHINHGERIDKTSSKAFNDTRDIDVLESGDETVVHEGRTTGNIGVTTTQQMLQSEREVANYSFYDELFWTIISEMCYTVY